MLLLNGFSSIADQPNCAIDVYIIFIYSILNSSKETNTIGPRIQFSPKQKIKHKNGRVERSSWRGHARIWYIISVIWSYSLLHRQGTFKLLQVQKTCKVCFKSYAVSASKKYLKSISWYQQPINRLKQIKEVEHNLYLVNYTCNIFD